MKTVQELHNEILASDELKKAFVEAMKAGKLEDFMKAHGCEATAEEIKEYIEAKAAVKTLSRMRAITSSQLFSMEFAA